MADPVEPLLLASLIISAVTLAILMCLLIMQLSHHPRRPDTPIPPQVQHAMEQLHTVTERKHQRDYRGSNDDTECPICLASFSGASRNASRRGGKNDLETGLSLLGTITTITAGGSRQPAQAPPKKHTRFQPLDSDILKITRCGHAFHSRCLVTWFLREEQNDGKHNCPLCRVEYYPARSQSAPEREREQE
ncbi:hypothetical protein GQX73_g10810 [Xylaria multiplex]|uniref:RING-type domain-containing protein n=1 Tax=Xylaria multiplex TaxID=323545 RepID=A0A7C8IJK1_9PEZI|nr:hypothetical protein GQX73_g10810 [Xylaria multiplex]